MVERASGVKQSNFTAQTSIVSGSYIGFFAGGYNYKISYDNFLSGLGVTGTIVQDGAVTGVPVLDAQGTVNNIRNLEAGAGIAIAVSAENGIAITHAFLADAVGTPLLVDVGEANPTVRSLSVAGGLSLAVTDNNVQLSSNSLFNRVIVTQASDLAGTLLSTAEYFIDGIIDMGFQSIEVPQGGLTLRGYNFDISRLTSSANTYTMFTSPAGGSGNVLGADYAIEVTGTSSQVYNLTSDTGAQAFEFTRVNYNNCTSLGTITNYRQGLESGTGRFGGTPSLTLAGAWAGGYFIDTSIVRSLSAGMTGALFIAGAGFSMSSRFRSNQNVDLPASAALLDFSASNFVNPSTLQLEGCIVSRNGVIDASDANLTPNIAAAALASSWSNNQGLDNTFPGGTLNITTEVSTVIATQNTFVDLLGTYTAIDLQHFDEPASGQLRHLGNSPREFRIVGDLVIAGTGNDVVVIKVVKWDNSASVFVDIAQQARQINTLVGGRDVTFFNISVGFTLDQNDYIKLQITNATAARNAAAEIDSFCTILER